MREKMLRNRASRIPLLVIFLLFLSLAPCLSSTLRSAAAATQTVTTSITGNTVGGNFSTQVLPPQAGENIYGIQGGQTVGTNLFHSFGHFDVGPGDIAQFQTSTLTQITSISNILGRVTGQQSPSQIFGTVDSATYYPTANLFLMNPYGFLFGPNATVNVGGMMTFTTADYLRLADVGRFNANPNAIPGDLLTSAPVASYGFLGANPAAITFEGGQLTIAGGTGLALVGGDINLNPDTSGTPSGITAHGRSILMTSVAGPGEVAADTGIPAAGMTLGTFTLAQGTMLDTSGNPSFGDGSGNGGAVSIRGGQFVATGATILTNPAFGSTGQGGAVMIAAAGSATLTNSIIQTGPVAFNGAGSAGAVSITADTSLTMTNTIIDATAISAGGDAGSVTLQTSGPLLLTDSFIGTSASAPGNGGAVTIAGQDVTFTRSALFTDVDDGSFGFTPDPVMSQVHPGAVTVTAQNTVTLSGSFAGDPGIPIISTRTFDTPLDAGSVTIASKTVDLSNGSIDATTSAAVGDFPRPGTSGTIEIRGNDVNLSQFNLTSNNSYGFASTGKGGNILLRGFENQLASSIQLTDSQINVASVTSGGSGTIEFQTQGLTLSNTIVVADAFSAGPAGSITVHGAQSVTLRSNSVMESSALTSLAFPAKPVGPAGTILIETQQFTMQGGSALKAADDPQSRGNAGSITVRGTDGPAQSILIDGAGTGIFTDAEGNGAGGSINLYANSVTLQNGGTLSAATSGTKATATGGTITVDATNTVTMNSASITASSTGVADAGNINITAPNGFTMQHSTIKTEAGQGAGGGNIKVTTSPEATVLLQGSTISASVADGHGGGGNISIDPQFVILQNSQILAQAAQGQGGAITITTNVFLPDANSIVNADSGSGVNGTVTIQSPNAPISGQIQPLGKTPLISTSLLNQHCASLAGGEFSSFIVAGRDSLPTEPGSWFASPLALGPTGFSAGAIAEGGAQARVIDPAQETTVLSLRQIAPAGFLTQAFAVDWLASCQS
jgi:filamentous hemagglutinin family protein